MLTNMAVGALIIAALYFGREIFVPLALAVLLSFALAPFVMRLHSWRIPRTASVLIVVFFGFSIIFSLGGLMVSQATRLAAKLPGYQQTLSDKVESLRGLMGGSGTLEQASTVLKKLDTELKQGNAAGQTDNGPARQKTVPIPVEIQQPDPGALTTLAKIIELFHRSRRQESSLSLLPLPCCNGRILEIGSSVLPARETFSARPRPLMMPASA